MIINEASAEPTLDLWGDFSTVLRNTKNSGDVEDSSKLFNTLTLSASSYIWRPWFAVYNGTLGLTTDKTEYEDAAEYIDEESVDAEFGGTIAEREIRGRGAFVRLTVEEIGEAVRDAFDPRKTFA